MYRSLRYQRFAFEAIFAKSRDDVALLRRAMMRLNGPAVLVLEQAVRADVGEMEALFLGAFADDSDDGDSERFYARLKDRCLCHVRSPVRDGARWAPPGQGTCHFCYASTISTVWCFSELPLSEGPAKVFCYCDAIRWGVATPVGESFQAEIITLRNNQ